MYRAHVVALAFAVAGIIACTDGLILPADPNQTGLGPAGGGAGATTRTVTIGDNFFSPDTLTVFVSDTVTWVWTGVNPHSVSFSDSTSSGTRVSGTFQRFFGLAGTYPYTSNAPTDSAVRGTITVLAR